MTTKPPFGMSASGHTGRSDSEDLESRDANADATTAEADERVAETLEPEVGDEARETPPPLLASPSADRDDPESPAAHSALASRPGPATARPRRSPTLLGFGATSLPLPGVRASGTAEPGDDEVTVLARPSITDDDEEATKVEPPESVLQAAVARDGIDDGDEDDDGELAAALSTQATVERDKALRKSGLPSLDLPLSSPSRAADAIHDFEDLDDDVEEMASDTPAEIPLDDEVISSYSADPEEPLSELEAVLAPRRPAGAPFESSLGRGDGAGARLPTPSPGTLGFAVPGPSSSPFFARTAPAGSPYGSRITSSAPMPAIQIPAPSGAAATPGTGSGVFTRVGIPIGGLVSLVVAVFIGGVVLGAKFWRAPAPVVASTTPAAPASPASAAPAPIEARPPTVVPTRVAAPAPGTAPAPAAPPAPAVPPPAAAVLPVPAAVAATHGPAAVAATRAPAAASKPPAPTAPVAVAAGSNGETTPGATAHPAKRTVGVGRPRKSPGDVDEAAALAPPAPKPPRPAKKKVWVDPFAE